MIDMWLINLVNLIGYRKMYTIDVFIFEWSSTAYVIFCTFTAIFLISPIFLLVSLFLILSFILLILTNICFHIYKFLLLGLKASSCFQLCVTINIILKLGLYHTPYFVCRFFKAVYNLYDSPFVFCFALFVKLSETNSLEPGISYLSRKFMSNS